MLIEEGLLTWEECNAANFGQDPEKVDYGALYENRGELLRTAYKRFAKKGEEKDYEKPIGE